MGRFLRAGLLAPLLLLVCLFVGRTTAQEKPVAAPGSPPSEGAALPDWARHTPEEYEQNLRQFGINFIPAIFSKIGNLVHSFIDHSSRLEEAHINQFLDNYYGALDDSSTAFMDEVFAEDSKMNYSMINGSMHQEWIALGKDSIMESAESWFDFRGDLLAPTNYTVVGYQSPILVVDSFTSAENHPNGKAANIFGFRGEEVRFLGVFVDAKGELPETAPPQVVQMLDQFFSDLDSKETASIDGNFADDVKLCAFLGWPEEGLQMKIFTHGVQAFKHFTRLGWAQPGDDPTSSKYTILHYRFPLLVVRGEQEQPAGSGQKRQQALYVWHLSRNAENNTYTVLGQGVSLDIYNQTLPETFQKWAFFQ